MKKFILLLIPLLCAVLAFVGYMLFFNKEAGRGALQVTAVPQSNVYLSGKLIGQTPLCKCEAQEMIPIGDYTLKLSPKDPAIAPFEQKITITKSILTVVDRTFGKGAESEGSIITLTPLDDKTSTEIQVLSVPNKTDVFLDNNLMGSTPLLLKNITESDHEIKLQKAGYKEKVVRIRTVAGYVLEVMAYLGINDAAVAVTPTPLPTLVPTLAPSVAQITILQTPVGFLRVRESASVTSAEVGRVQPGETYDIVSEENGWYQIKLPSGTNGWVSNQYAQKVISTPTPASASPTPTGQ